MSETWSSAARLLPNQPVSRETWARLEAYASELRKWEPAQNLVGPATLNAVWSRHIADSLQLLPMIPAHRRIVDIGSGAGFPGLVLAIARGEGGGPVHLVESNKRKAAFLRAAARAASTKVDVHADRAESALSRLAVETSVGTVTARALAPLVKLLELTEPATTAGAKCVFPKGQNFQAEIDAANKQWKFDVDIVQSVVAQDSVILRLSSISRR
ncbi:16S rRNA (guanine(527)-N(7))-methyltransferase RsmG [Tepidamorphus sp. 3E244]|uniref:16S rRNA (guanine(527)-N(7))-methyltransferase RsmG n=1 Tax=Tepidamorphus sp. 3E244 TaxID=3385498 RepID=UPI0038FCE92B